MNRIWFEDIVREWTPNVSWDASDLNVACELLAEISTLNGGETIKDVEIDQEAKMKHAIHRAMDCIQRRLNYYAQSGNIHISDRYYKKETDLDRDLLPFLTPKKLTQKLDLNRATSDELEALPGIGSVTAERIVEYREVVAPFQTLEEVKKVKGISKRDFEAFENMVYIALATENPTLRSGLLNTFYRDPSIQNYLDLVEDENYNTQELLIRELTEIRYDLGVSKYSSLAILPQIRTSSVESDLASMDDLTALETRQVSDNAQGRLIFDGQYEPFIEKLLSHCASSLRIIMFFFRFEDEASYPTDPLVQQILNAKSNGVEVQVILDIDEADDPYNSESINSNIHRYLSSKGIDVKYDAPDIVTHSKVIIMDSRHVVVGSHNWTAGSFYQYDDTSVYIDSEELAGIYETFFEDRWNQLADNS